jgi:hypothetical protein
MNSKRLIFFLLISSLLLLPVTSYYAVSWDDLKQKAQNFVNKEAVDNVLPGLMVAIGIVGGLYYYLTKKDDDDLEKGQNTVIHKKDPLSLGSMAVQSSPDLEQLQVYCQFNDDGGGGASCGYQTLLRSMQVVKGKSENESDEALQKLLNDPIAIDLYFGKDGEWRQAIIERRKEQELKKALHKKFILALNQGGDEKAKELYKSSLGFLEDIMVSISRSPEENIKQYDFTDEAICNYLLKSLEQLKNKKNEDLISKLQNVETINQYFNLKKMREEFFSQEFILQIPVLTKEINNRSDLQDDFLGEWLSDGEVEYLWQEKHGEIIPRNVTCGFKATANFEFVGNKKYPDLDEVTPYIEDNMKSLNEKQQFFTIFALGTMRQGSDTVGTRGHWYPLVMYQDSEGKRKYYIMDSGSRDKTNRLRDINARKIINLIEQYSIKK